MNKKVLIIGAILLFCAQIVIAQSPCETTFENAKKLYLDKDYSSAKVKFQKVIDNCDSNKEIAQEYVKLCDEFIRLANEQKITKKPETVDSDICSKEISRLNDRINHLEKERETIQTSIMVAADKMRGQDAIIVAKTDTIQQLQDSIKNRLLPIVQEKESLETQNMMTVDSLRTFGRELNAYLESKWLTVNKEQIVNCDSINDAFTLIKAMRDNLYLVTKKK